MASWPGALPDPLIVDYAVGDAPRIIETPLSSGPSRRTRVSNHYMTTGNASIVVDQAGAAAFRQLMVDSRQGADWITDVPLDTGEGVANHRARLANVRWRVANMVPGQNWQVTFSFETDERL